MTADDNRFKNKSAAVLRELQTIISRVEKGCARSRFAILPAFHSVRNVGTIKSWHHMEVLFLCSVEYRAKNIESQIRALERIGALSEHIAAIRGETEWRLPTGKILWTHYEKGPDGKSHPRRTEEDLAGDTPQSSPGGPPGVSFNIAAGALGFSYSPGARPTVGMLVSYRYASHRAV